MVDSVLELGDQVEESNQLVEEARGEKGPGRPETGSGITRCAQKHIM